MKSWNKYFNAPIYESSKSSYALHYQTELERSLMEVFDASSEVNDYFQPLMEISIDGQSEETDWLRIDFWLDCKNGKTILVHVANETSLNESGKLLRHTKPFCDDSSFELIVLRSADNDLTPINETVQAKLFEA
jgi:hypothetical protein